MSGTKNRDKKVLIFGLIGVFNTLFDLVLYVVIYNATNSIIFANIAATTAALIGSYILNSRLTFKSNQWTLKSFALFLGVTIFGLWVLQTAVIYAITPALNHIPQSLWSIAGGFEETLRTLLPKILATGVTLVWNFVWYNRVIFKNESKRSQAIIALEEA